MFNIKKEAVLSVEEVLKSNSNSSHKKVIHPRSKNLRTNVFTRHLEGGDRLVSAHP